MEVLIDYAYKREDLEGLPIADVARFVLAREGRPDSTEVSISFVDDDTIARLNREYRGMEGPTDVLSFECDNAETADEAAIFGAATEEPVYELGDIVIAVDVARRQCAEFGTTFQQEIVVLLIHGLLHLCGYDHIDPADAAIMEPREDELRAEWEEAQR